MLNNRSVPKSTPRPDPREIPLCRAIEDLLWKLQPARVAVRDYIAEVVAVGHASEATRKELRAAVLAAAELLNLVGLADAEANESDAAFNCVRFDPDTCTITFDPERKDATLMGEITALLFQTSLPR